MMDETLVLKLPKPHPLQEEIYLDKTRFKVVITGRRFGKPLAIDTPILTLDYNNKPYYTELYNIMPGDYVFSELGKPVMVTYVSDVQYGKTLYDIEFSTGEVITAAAEHPWVVNTPEASGVEMTTEELYKSFKKNQYSITPTQPIEFPGENEILETPGYVMGYHIGDGSVNTNRVTIGDEDYNNVYENFSKRGYELKPLSNKYSYKISNMPYKSFENSIKVHGRNLKYIPDEYMLSSTKDRLELLKGICDSDGTIKPDGRVEITTISLLLKNQYETLLYSLGIPAKTYISVRDGKPVYRVYFKPDYPVFDIKRKSDRTTKKPMVVKIFSITPRKTYPTKCISVDNPTQMYLVGKSNIPTHNTELGKLFVARTLLAENGSVAWFSPTHDMYKTVMRYFMEHLQPIIKYQNAQERYFEFANGGKLKFWSAQNTASVRGQKYNLAVMDEAAYYKSNDLWQAVVRPTLADYNGLAVFLSTPNGRNWLYELYLSGLDGNNKEFKSWNYSSKDSPFFNLDEYNSAKIAMPERIFRQEYDAQFLINDAEVFKNIDQICSGDFEFPNPDEEYVFGVDFGRKQDFTVAMVYSTKRKAFVNMLVINKVSYNTIVDELVGFYEQWRPTKIVAESNSAGDVLIELLRDKNLPIEEFYSTNSSKAAIIQPLALAFEKQSITAVRDPELIRQLQAYTITITPSEKTRYAASYGNHDDMVVAMALAFYGDSSNSKIYSSPIPVFY